MLDDVRRLAAMVALVALTAAGCSGADPTVRVLAASSLTETFTEIAASFEKGHPQIGVVVSYSASAAIREQVLDGAQADVVAMAGLAPMQPLIAAGEIDGAVRPFATNRLTIAVPAGNPGNVTSLGDLGDPELFVGVCAPGVPCGDLAVEAFAAAGVTPEIDTVEPNVKALLAKLAAGELDAGLVYVTDVLASGGTVESIVIPDTPTTTYVAARIGGGEATDRFLDFLESADGRAILERHGFAAP